MNSERERLAAAIRAINDAWLENRVQDVAPWVHADIVTVAPGFAARFEGREALLAGLQGFCDSAEIARFEEGEHQIDVAGATAVVSYRFEMLFERTGQRYRGTGRDLWVFEKQGHAWLAVWRTMLDVHEDAV